MDFVVFCLNPGQLIDDFVSPLVHALVAYVHLRVKDPKEAKTFDWELLDWDVDDFLVRHCLIFKVEFVIWKHKACVVALSSFDSPWRVNVYNFKVP
mgnify:CR=1 FL=1